jgi:hypothetical protein
MSSFVESAEMFVAPAKGRPWKMNPAILIQKKGERLSINHIKVKKVIDSGDYGRPLTKS